MQSATRRGSWDRAERVLVDLILIAESHLATGLILRNGAVFVRSTSGRSALTSGEADVYRRRGNESISCARDRNEVADGVVGRLVGVNIGHRIYMQQHHFRFADTVGSRGHRYVCTSAYRLRGPAIYRMVYGWC